MKIMFGNNRFFMTLPKDKVRMLAWKKGDDIEVNRIGKQLILEKIEEEK